VVDNPEHGVTRIAFGDADDDGLAEIYFGAGYSSTGPDILYAIDTANQELEWESLDISGPFYGLAHGDIDGDGAPELVYTTFESESGYGDGLYFVHDAVTKQLEYQSPMPTGSNWTGLWKVQVADVAGDGALEIFLPTSYTYSGALQCIDGATHELWWEVELDRGTAFASLRLGDPDADGLLETITASDVQSTGAEGVYVYVHDAASGVQEWTSPNLQSFFGYWSRLTLLRIADIDDDGIDEILVTQPGSDLLALDRVTGTIDLSTSGIEVTALEIADLDGDGTPDIVIGTQNGLLQRVDPVSGAPTTLAGPFGAPIDAVAVATIVGDQSPDFVVCCADRVLLIDGSTLEPVWVSDELGTGVGQNDSLIVGDLDLDGRVEIWVNAGSIGHLMFEVTETDRTSRWRRVPRPTRLSPRGR